MAALLPQARVRNGVLVVRFPRTQARSGARRGSRQARGVETRNAETLRSETCPR
jgi:hypothetical protein